MKKRPIWVNYFGLVVAVFFLGYILIDAMVIREFSFGFDFFIWFFIWLVFLHNFNIIREFDPIKGNGF